jgi:hypothetical protein
MNRNKRYLSDEEQEIEVRKYIDELLRMGKPEEEPSLSAPYETNINLIDRDQKAKKLGERYMAMLLRRNGRNATIMKEGQGYDINVQPPDRNNPMRYDIQVERQLRSPYIGIETFRVINGEKVASGINDTMADQYVVLVCGMPGIFQIPTKNLKAILNDHCLEEVTIPYENGCYYVSVIERQLLLDNALHLTP